MMTRYTFDEVAIKATFRWKEDGKSRQRTKTFWQTMNPFNVNADGLMKSRDEILEQLRAERDKWLEEMKHEAAQ
jgi:hypothetical protein